MKEIKFPDLRTERFKLGNGLNVIVREDHSNPVVSLQAWCETGSIHEGKHLGTGVSHFVEHMVFKGTKHRESLCIAQDVSSIGGNINAYTSFDRTVYYIDSPANGIEKAIEILHDIVFQAIFPKKEFEPEREVIRREISMGKDDADKVASQEMFNTCYQKHPFGLPVIGYLDNFNSLSHSDVVEYYKDRYVPDNIFLVISGDVSLEKIRPKIQEFFEKPSRQISQSIYVPQEPMQLGRRDSFVNFTNPITRFWMAWKIPSITDKDTAAIDVMAVILGQGRSSRLFRSLKEELGLVHSINAYSYTPSYAGIFAIGAGIDSSNKHVVEQKVFDILNKVKNEGIDEEEIQKAKRIALVSQLESLLTVQGQASDIGSNWSVTRNVDFTKEYIKRISMVATEDVLDVAKRYLIDDTLSVVEVGNKKESSSEVFINRGIKKKIINHSLENGLKVYIEEDHRLPLMSYSTVFKAGLFADKLSGNGMTQLLSRVLLKGTKNFEADQIALKIESLGGSVLPVGGNNSLSINSEFLSNDFEEGVKIVSDITLSSIFPDRDLKIEKSTLIAEIREEIESPLSLAVKTARENLFGQHAHSYSRLGVVDDIEGCDSLSLKNFYSNYVNSRNGVISLCGAVDNKMAIDKIEEFYSGIKMGDKVDPMLCEPQWPIKTKEIEISHHKEQAVFLVAYPGLRLSDEDRSVMAIIEEIAGGMDGLLFVRIRENLGLAYYVGMSQMLGYSRGNILFYVGTSKEALPKVQVELESIIESLISEKIGEDILSRAKNSLIGKYSLSRQSYSSRSQSTALNILYGLGDDYDQKSIQQIKEVDSDNVLKCAKKYFNTESKVIVKIIPSGS
tara:strand:+ start:12708 stop:15242 length:2535 start_codon:yes stop_codon:yes gene_type:complete